MITKLDIDYRLMYLTSLGLAESPMYTTEYNKAHSMICPFGAQACLLIGGLVQLHLVDARITARPLSAYHNVVAVHRRASLVT